MDTPSINFYTSDFLTETIFLDFEEKGKLITLLCIQHQHGKLSMEQIKQICGTVSDNIMKFFKKDDDDKYYNEKIEEYKTKRENFIRKQKENIAKRWNKNTKEHTKPIPNQYQPIYQTDTKQGSLEIPIENENGNDYGIEIEDVVKEKRVVREKSNSNIPAKPRKKSPQAIVYDYFAEKYKHLTGIDYRSTKADFSNLSDLVKQYGIDQVKQKIDWLEIGCTHPGVYWFATDINAFTINKLINKWNEILPVLTDEQRKQKEKLRKEQETKRAVEAELAKQGITLKPEPKQNSIIPSR